MNANETSKILELVDEKNKILRTPSSLWEFDDSGKAASLMASMAQVMISNNGMGLAANQVGLNHRCFIMGDTHKVWECFNPEIIERLGVIEKSQEGCLSFPNLVLDIERHSIILVRYFTSKGQLVEDELTGRWARCFQHELDHIDGICFDQKVTRLALGIAQRKRAKSIKRK